MTDFDDFLGKSRDTGSDKQMFEKVEGAYYECIVCSKKSIEVLFDPVGISLYWYCADGHESKVDLSVGTIRD